MLFLVHIQIPGLDHSRFTFTDSLEDAKAWAKRSLRDGCLHAEIVALKSDLVVVDEQALRDELALQ